MAKRRRLTVPEPSDLKDLEEGFAAKPSLNPFEGAGVTPPIAQVAAEAAALNGMASVTDRAALAKDQGDASKWREAHDAGLVAEKLPIDMIDTDFIRRDRMVEDEEAMAELIESLRENGLRAPIEVSKTADGYGLISGYRRLNAFRNLSKTDPRFMEIPAFVRHSGTGQEAYVSMVEENELRANLSPYERGRIAVLAVGQGIFTSTEEAVDTLFATASKAKRSKVRSFALVHESLGDILRYPVELTEKSGLALASALRSGAQAELRNALAGSEANDARSELVVLNEALKSLAQPANRKARGGRPQQIQRLTPLSLPGGGGVMGELTANEVRIRISLDDVTFEDAQGLLEEIAKHLS